MESLGLGEENISKDIRIFLDWKKKKQLKRETIDTTIKDIRNIFRLEKENEKKIKDRILGDIRNAFTLEKKTLHVKIIIKNSN